VRSRTVVAALCASALIRISVTDEYLRFVRSAMHLPLLISGLILAAFAIADIAGWLTLKSAQLDEHDETETPSRVVWLLLLPVLAIMVAMPAPLGGWGLSRQQNVNLGTTWPKLSIISGAPTPVALPDFVGRALEPGSPTISGVEVEIVGFVSARTDQSFTIARYSIACCAADATGSSVTVIGQSSPNNSSTSTQLQWVRVVGKLDRVDGFLPSINAVSVQLIAAPPDPYI
jgi:uncharacterized repeat protein (TIGR03943 family)